MAQICDAWTYLLVSLVAGTEGAVHPLQAQVEVRDAVKPHNPPGRDVLHARRWHGLDKLQPVRRKCHGRYYRQAQDASGTRPASAPPQVQPEARTRPALHKALTLSPGRSRFQDPFLHPPTTSRN